MVESSNVPGAGAPPGGGHAATAEPPRGEGPNAIGAAAPARTPPVAPPALLILAIGLAVGGSVYHAAITYDRRAGEAAAQRQLAEQHLQERELAAEARAGSARELQALAAFLPFVLGEDEAAKQTALVTMSALGYGELATKLSEQVGGRGATAALSVMANTDAGGDETARSVAQQALEALVRPYQGALANVDVHYRAGDGIDYRSNAFVVDERGYLVTTVHPFDTIPEAELDITVHFGSTLDEGLAADLVAMDDDLALLRVDTANLPPVMFAENAAQTEPGAYVTVMSFPTEAAEPVLTSGRAVGLDRSGNVMIDSLRGMAATGAPVFNASGEVVGVTRVVLGQPRGVAVPIERVVALLAQVRVER